MTIEYLPVWLYVIYSNASTHTPPESARSAWNTVELLPLESMAIICSESGLPLRSVNVMIGAPESPSPALI
jgi:hypothetical protein